MANLVFDHLHDVAPPPKEPLGSLHYDRTVDCRSVTFESGLTVMISEYMADAFERYLASDPENRDGPAWLQEAWETTLDVINNQKLNEVQRAKVTMYLLGRADHIIMYQQFVN